MQFTTLPAGNYYASPPRRGPGLWIALACAGCGVLVMLLIVLVVVTTLKAVQPAHIPAPYVGTWEMKHSAKSITLALAADGKAEYLSQTKAEGSSHTVHITAAARVDESARRLSIGSGGVEIRVGGTDGHPGDKYTVSRPSSNEDAVFHIDVAPHTVQGVTEMTLDGEVFKRTGEYKAIP